MGSRVAAALLLGLPLVAGGCSEPSAPNFLILIADDLGTDKVGAYGEAESAPPTPNIDALAHNGLLFRHAYTPPTCSPARAALLTGRHPRRFGLGTRLRTRKDRWQLPLEELTLPEVVDRGGTDYTTSAVGKWHLATYKSASNLRHPLDSGFDWFAGSVANLMITRESSERGSYSHWEKNENGKLAWSRIYATTDTVDDALARIAVMKRPWLLWVAFNAPHSPHHVPPADLHTRPEVETKRQQVDAAVEALDTEIGRLLRGIPEKVRADTIVIFLGDNGTAPSAADRQERAKNTVYEGGVRVPLIIAGRGVVSGEVAALVDVTDIFPTVAELAGVPPEKRTGAAKTLDGVSLAPYLADPGHASLRETVYQEVFEPNGAGPYTREDRMIRNERYKLISRRGEEALLFDLRESVHEGEPLPASEAPEVRRRLEQQLDEMTRKLSAPES